MDSAELVDQLRRLGLSRGVSGLKPQPRRRGPAIQDLLPGELVYTDQGSFFLYRQAFDLGYRHGSHALADLLAHPPQRPACLARDERLAGVDPSRVAFVDTETTGLAGGTGTCAFLVGVGVFDEGAFALHQFFMRDLDEEAALLGALGELLDGLEAAVTFNGRSFDLPLLETRFVLARQPPRLVDAPHLDLLPAARRFWKYRLDSCALSSLEVEVLGVRRAMDDVPGWLIPSLYTDYLRSGDAREMPRIFYHNAQDILSLVTLAARLCDLLAGEPGLEGLPGEDLYGLGHFCQELGDWARAETLLAQAALTCHSASVGQMAMRDLAYLLKRRGRGTEALPWWQRLAETGGAVYACEELAKHYEWQAGDLSQAAAWTQRGLALAGAWPPGPQRRETLAELEHRLARLQRKLRGQEDPADLSPEPSSPL